MARPPKDNAEYFSHTANLRNDRRVKSLRRKYEHTGYSIYTMLRELICDAPHFHLPFDAEHLEELGGDVSIDGHFLHEIVMYCVDRRLLQLVERNGRKYLTDHELIRSLSDLLSKRKLDAEGIIKLFSAPETVVSASETPVSSPETTVSGVHNPQREGKERKEDKSERTPNGSNHGEEKRKGVSTATTQVGPSAQENAPKIETSKQPVHPVEAFAAAFRGDRQLMERTRKALRMKNEENTEEYVIRLLNVFEAKFILMPVQQTMEKFRFKFGDWINDPMRKPLPAETTTTEKAHIADFM